MGYGQEAKNSDFQTQEYFAEQKKKTSIHLWVKPRENPYKEILPSVHLLNSGTWWDGKVENLSRKSLNIRLELAVFLQQKN